MSVRVLLLDVEGTIGPTRFVREVLFPYAEMHLDAFLAGHPQDPAVLGAVAAVRAELPDTETAEGLRIWMQRDLKAPALKELQGRIWEQGFRTGALTAPIHADAVRALTRFASAGHLLAIYSSGSVFAQRLYLEHSDHGDLRALIHSHFDTTVGDKGDPDAYARIAEALGVARSAITFASDAVRELDAAAEAGLGTVRISRVDEPGSAATSRRPHPTVATFDPLSPAVPPGLPAA